MQGNSNSLARDHGIYSRHVLRYHSNEVTKPSILTPLVQPSNTEPGSGKGKEIRQVLKKPRVYRETVAS
jgi:hypothetical protein